MTQARTHSALMLDWWADTGLNRVDFAVRRPDGAMLLHRDLALTTLPLAWARAENARRSDIYMRPARGHDWPVVLLDDVDLTLALSIARKYAALVVHTSTQGGCHVWLRCTTRLVEDERRHAQRWLARRCSADCASTSGEHLGRAAGFKNWKRGGCWVNTASATTDAPPWDPRDALDAPSEPAHRGSPSRATATRDESPSAREWGWICGMLDAGVQLDTAYDHLLAAARARGRRQPARYASHTISNALRRRCPAAQE